MSTPQYELLKASITDKDCLRAFDFLCQHVGEQNKVSIERIALHLFASSGDNAIRKARDIVELLRTDYGVPVCSSSGRAGRWLAANEDEKQTCLADFYARRASIDAVIKALERAAVPAPARLGEPPKQLGLWG